METPSHTSIWRFRQTIDKLGLSTKLLAEVSRKLDPLGLVIKHGTMVDATLIAGALRRPYEGVASIHGTPMLVSCKRDKSYFGCKAHLAADEESSGPVRQAEMTPANVQDSRLGEALIQDEEPAPLSGPGHADLHLGQRRLAERPDTFSQTDQTVDLKPIADRAGHTLSRAPSSAL